MRFATFNVNSIRSRLETVDRSLEEAAMDNML